jgi:hypothetical protein
MEKIALMSELDSLIFAIAFSLFLFIGAAKLTVEQLIALVILLKKLRATIKAEYSPEAEELRTERERSISTG